MRTLVLATALLGCASSTNEIEVAKPHFEEAASWVKTLLAQPAVFGEAVNSDREGWIALHRGDWNRALKSTDPVVQFRTHANFSAFYRRLDRISAGAWTQTRTIWQQRPELNVEPALRSAAEIAEYSVVLSTAETNAVQEFSDEVRTRAQQTLGMHREQLIERANKPAFEVPGKSIRVQDPLVFRGLNLRHHEAYQQLSAPAGLPSVLFTACAESLHPGGSDPSHNPYQCLSGSFLQQAAQASSDLGTADDAQTAREVARELDSHLAAWRAHVAEAGSQEGQQLVADLQIFDIYRGQTLLMLAEHCLEERRPRQALALAQLAQDMSSPREIGPLNTPHLFAILAEANLLTGRYREALEPLEVLARVFPEVAGLDETVGDLSVLSSMNRQGDSKEL